ncbi:MAG TPA: endonuclease/exonuclease/phosphatase family protein [Bacteroidota bacterium]|nr:endonuclease/exonuclease/phosphatase family protein [Bacteroidota bacterium]
MTPLFHRLTAFAFPAAPLVVAFIITSCSSTKETAATPPPAGNRPLTATFKILSVNARHTLKGKSDVRKLSKVIKSTGADIVAVQQIERPQEGKTDFDAVQELAKQTEMYNFFGKARYFEGYDSGNALFSTYPVKQTAVQPLPVEEGKVRRSLTFGVIDVGLKEVGISSTELDDESSSMRVSETQAIISIAQSYDNVPVIVCGNFCESLSGRAASKMQEQFLAANALQESAQKSWQQVYAMKNQKLEPVAVEKVKFGDSGEALLVTMQVTQ